MRVTLAIAVGLSAGPLTVAAQANPEAGETAYQVCAGCHGFLAEGQALVNAPSLAGLESWYLARQMRYFQAGIRGSTEGDVNGQRMARMAGAVNDDRELEDLIAYIQRLPVRASPSSVAGNIESGRQHYQACAACHGADAEGSETLSAPGLADLDDWYLVEQLRLYAEGLRGMHPEDTYGQQMRAIASTFADERVRRDIAAYIKSLDR